MNIRFLPLRPVLALAICAGALAAFPASAQVAVSLEGDAAAQHARIVQAATRACRAEYRSDAYGRDHLAACVKATVGQAVARAGDARLLAYHRDQSTRRFTLASLAGR